MAKLSFIGVVKDSEGENVTFCKVYTISKTPDKTRLEKIILLRLNLFLPYVNLQINEELKRRISQFHMQYFSNPLQPQN